MARAEKAMEAAKIVDQAETAGWAKNVERLQRESAGNEKIQSLKTERKSHSSRSTELDSE